jgi:hypothetical protein
VKVMVTVQLEEAARVAPQVLLEITKSPALAPEIAMLPMAICEVPMLEMVTDWGVPLEPSATLPHASIRGSIRTPATRQPAREKTRRERNTTQSRERARVRLTVRGRLALRVNVPSSSFILLGGKRIKPRREAVIQRNRKGCNEVRCSVCSVSRRPVIIWPNFVCGSLMLRWWFGVGSSFVDWREPGCTRVELSRI